MVAIRAFSLESLEHGTIMLYDAGYVGSKYTWHNNQQGKKGIWATLDRVLIYTN